MNNDLYNSAKGEIEFPSTMRDHMKKCFHMVKGADENTEGFNRNKELQGKNFIEYKQLKRIKNFFDNFNGGVEMKNWVNNELRKMRDYTKMTKTNKMDAGMMNQFIKPHEKKNFNNVRPSQQHDNTFNKHDAAVTESLKRINEIMKQL